jgi:hypothetical protein
MGEVSTLFSRIGGEAGLRLPVETIRMMSNLMRET